MKTLPILFLLPLLSACSLSNQAEINTQTQTQTQTDQTATETQTQATPTSADPDQQLLDGLQELDDKEIDASYTDLETELK